jgi:hypothetical protein
MSVGQVQASKNDALLNLDVADANARQRNQQGVLTQNNNLARYQQNAWDWNKRQKFLETAASVRALMGAGNANTNQGLDRGIGGLGSIASWGLNKMKGNNSGSNESGYQSNTSIQGGNPTRYSTNQSSEFQTDF